MCIVDSALVLEKKIPRKSQLVAQLHGKRLLHHRRYVAAHNGSVECVIESLACILCTFKASLAWIEVQVSLLEGWSCRAEELLT
jgi:hypothetical protein